MLLISYVISPKNHYRIYVNYFVTQLNMVFFLADLKLQESNQFTNRGPNQK